MDGWVMLVPITFFIASAVVLAPLVRAHARRIENRSAGPGITSGVQERLERMEQAIDSIAIEVERISEGQRFTTRLLSESRSADALPRGRFDT